MLHAGLDLSRRRLDVCLLDERGELAGELAIPPDVDGLHGLVRRLHGHRVRAACKTDRIDAQKVKGLAPLVIEYERRAVCPRHARRARLGGARR